MKPFRHIHAGMRRAADESESHARREPAEVEFVAEVLGLLERRTFRTYQSRLRASQRLAFRDRAWNAALIALTTGVTIASVALLAYPNLYGAGGPTLLVCVSILALIASLTTSGLNYSGRSRDMFLNYRRVQRLSAEIETAAKAPERVSTDDLSRFSEQYNALLDESENHTQADFLRAFPVEGKKSSTWRETAISTLPYISLAVPAILLVPFVIWLIGA